MGEYTSDQDLNAVLREWTKGAKAVLGTNFVGAYLQGSIALGDWDVWSDVDFLTVVEQAVTEEELAGLQEVHARIFQMGSHWAQHLEGSYFPRDVLSHNSRVKELVPFLNNTHDQLTPSEHDNTLVVRWMTRERGIVLSGPDPKDLIEPVSGEALREEVRETIKDWGDEILFGRYPINNRWAQPFAALMYCRMLHTLETGRVESKRAGVEWAKKSLEPRWVGLVEYAWEQRSEPSLKIKLEAEPGKVKETMEFIREIIESRE
jgi:hypothetical protein